MFSNGPNDILGSCAALLGVLRIWGKRAKSGDLDIRVEATIQGYCCHCVSPFPGTVDACEHTTKSLLLENRRTEEELVF